MTQREMMQIGEFAQATGLTVKALRLYHKRGILEPSWTDPWTGYRYYDRAALERAEQIVQLRALDVSLSEIGAILRAAEGRAGQVTLVRALEAQRASIRGQLARYSAMLQTLDTTLREGREVVMRTTETGHAAGAKSNTPEARLEAWAERVRRQRAQDHPTPEASVTVSSLCGVGGGAQLAAVLGQRVGFDVWDGATVRALAGDAARRGEVLALLDDAQRDALADVLARGPLQDGASQEARWQAEVTVAIALQGRAIFVEQGAHALLGVRPVGAPEPERGPGLLMALRVRLEPAWDALVAHHAARAGLDPAAAEADMQARHEALEREAAEAYGATLRDPAAYDLVINASTFTLYHAVELVVEGYEARFTPEPGWSYGASVA